VFPKVNKWADQYINSLDVQSETGKCKMRKTALLFGVLIIASMMLVFVTMGIRPVEAEADYSIGQVFHTVTIMYNGYVFINDTFELNNVTGAPNDFLMGFPDQYGQDVLKSVAFNDSSSFPVTLNTPLNGHAGFYGVTIDFPHGTPQVFTVGFVLSYSLLTQTPNSTLYELNFPAYPSLMKEAALCNVSIMVPQGAVYIGGTVSGFTYDQPNLPELTRLPATLDFNLTEQSQLMVDIASLSRVITVSGTGEVDGADTYYMTNEAESDLSGFQVFLPLEASNVEATDVLGRTLSITQVDAKTGLYEVDFNINATTGNSTLFVAKYSWPENVITRSSTNSALNLSLFKYENYYLDEALITIIFPEGASMNEIETNSTLAVNSIGRGIYQESVTLTQQGVVVLNSVSLSVSYGYNPFWSSFRPTIWLWAIATVGCIFVAATRRRPKILPKIPLSTTSLKLGPDFLRAFVDTYEEKMKIDRELESLEARMEKGRIPRRRYKVMRITLETRLDAAQRKLNESKERMRVAGGKYSGLMLQLEVAEAEIGEVKTNVKNAESLHNRGELSLEAYRNRLADYQRKKERAETTINGILLRLREETS